MKKGYSKYIILFVILAVLLLALAIKPLLTVVFGQEIYLQTRIYDPRDIFRGDYIHLAYEISEISTDKVDEELKKILKENRYDENQKIYIALSLEEKYHQVEKVTLTPPKEGVYLKAEGAYIRRREDSTMVVNYPWDKYYIPENTGKALEEKMRHNESYARIKVLNGYGVLMELIINEE